MTQNLERAKSRLNNIQTIEPLLGALRTMSMGAWQLANNMITRMQQYEENFHQILVEVMPYIKLKRARHTQAAQMPPRLTDTIILIIGTERGLCGKFNQSLADNALSWIETQHIKSYQIWALGTRMARALQKRNVRITWQNPLPTGDLNTYQHAYQTTQCWLENFESFDFNQFILLYNELGKGSGYHFSVCKLIPYEINQPLPSSSVTSRTWPPPIIDTDPLGIYHQVIQHFIASHYYQTLLKSAAAEHATRYTLMQEAKNNAEDIIEELGRVINTERKKKITQEMQELAVGAGLLEY